MAENRKISRGHNLEPAEPLSVLNKVGRAVWHLVWMFLFLPTPRQCHAWRCALLRLFGAKLGKDVHVYSSARIWAPWNLEMLDGSGIGEHVDVYCVNKILLKERAAVSQYTFLCTASHDYEYLDLPLITAPIVIGSNAWVTADVFIGPGVTIGEGSIVLARSTVLSDVPPWVVVGGNPASFKRARILRKEGEK
jgi:putative colanic acid biosynthesis acetyltransferase WcaF